SIFQNGNDSVILQGSINETYKGYDSNIENVTCISSWENEDLVGEYKEIFEEIWNGNHIDIATLDFSKEIKSIAQNIIRTSKRFRILNTDSLINVKEIKKILSNSPLYESHFYENIRLLPHQME